MGGRGAGFNKKNKGSVISSIADDDLKVKDWFQNKIELPHYVLTLDIVSCIGAV